MRTLDILIPHARPGVIFALSGLVPACLEHPTVRDSIRVILRDSGDASPLDEANQLLIDALSNLTSVTVIRSLDPNEGVFKARHDLFLASSSPWVMWLDSDVIIKPASLYWAWAISQFCMPDKDTKELAFSGVKREVYSSRKYLNDIHPLGGNEAKGIAQSKTHFLDTAISLWSRSVLAEVPWDYFSSLDCKGLAGEDVIMSALALKENEGTLTNDLFGYHIAYPRFRWQWEPATDRLMATHLDKMGISKQVISKIYPHL